MCGVSGLCDALPGCVCGVCQSFVWYLDLLCVCVCGVSGLCDASTCRVSVFCDTSACCMWRVSVSLCVALTCCVWTVSPVCVMP